MNDANTLYRKTLYWCFNSSKQLVFVLKKNSLCFVWCENKKTWINVHEKIIIVKSCAWVEIQIITKITTPLVKMTQQNPLSKWHETLLLPRSTWIPLLTLITALYDQLSDNKSGIQ